MEVWIVTGVRGAGKTTASKALEEIGFYRLDNLPPKLLCEAASLYAQEGGDPSRTVLTLDAHTAGRSDRLSETLDALRADGIGTRLIWLDADDETLLNRCRMARRMPGRADAPAPADALRAERESLSEIRELADTVIDTTGMTAMALREQIIRLTQLPVSEIFTLTVLSFGFAHGVPKDADLMFDVRCLPNPYYVTQLRPLTGLDRPVADYVFSPAESGTYFERLCGMLRFLLPLYIRDGRTRLTVAVGCSGGRHRSVAFAERLSGALAADGYTVRTKHRELCHE